MSFVVALLRAVAILDQCLSCLSTKAVPLLPKILSTQRTLPVSIDEDDETSILIWFADGLDSVTFVPPVNNNTSVPSFLVSVA